MVNLGFDLLVELACFILQIVYLDFIKHNYIVVSMFTEEALEANRTQVIFTKGLYVFIPMNFALRQILISKRKKMIRLWIGILTKPYVQFIVRVIRHMTCMDIFAFSLDPIEGATATCSTTDASTSSSSPRSTTHATAKASSSSTDSTVLLIWLVLGALVHRTTYLIIIASLHYFLIK